MRTQPNSKIGTRSRLSSALQALKYRNFKLFLGGQLISIVGNYIQTIAQAWLVYRLTGSAALLGLVAFSGQISIFVLAPISGVVADAKSRKHILFATQIAPMLLSFLLAALTLSGRVQVWHVFTVAALMGIVNAFDFPVRQAFVAELVPREDLISAVTLNSSMINSARTIGPGIGGLLVAGVGEGWCFLGNALSYVAVIIGLLMIKSTAAKKKTPQHFRAGVAEAFNFVRHTGPVGALLVLLGLISFTGLRYETGHVQQCADAWGLGGDGRRGLRRQSRAVVILALIRPVISRNVADWIYDGDRTGCLEHSSTANRARRTTWTRNGYLDNDAVRSGAFRFARSRCAGPAVYCAQNICRRRHGVHHGRHGLRFFLAHSPT